MGIYELLGYIQLGKYGMFWEFLYRIRVWGSTLRTLGKGTWNRGLEILGGMGTQGTMKSREKWDKEAMEG